MAQIDKGTPGSRVRIEKDYPGEKELPDTACCGVQTLRGKQNFDITGIPMVTFALFTPICMMENAVNGLAIVVKKGTFLTQENWYQVVSFENLGCPKFAQ